ncbi:uncharacterized protein LOC129012374 [Pongo pygmaeus]|uniref:uncharacterized protein LOC129012374 n=1 Tax=Pongo pygmaeus TaxID=9600 RepID=UPI00300C09C0
MVGREAPFGARQARLCCTCRGGGGAEPALIRAGGGGRGGGRGGVPAGRGQVRQAWGGAPLAGRGGRAPAPFRPRRVAGALGTSVASVGNGAPRQDRGGRMPSARVPGSLDARGRLLPPRPPTGSARPAHPWAAVGFLPRPVLSAAPTRSRARPCGSRRPCPTEERLAGYRDCGGSAWNGCDGASKQALRKDEGTEAREGTSQKTC